MKVTVLTMEQAEETRQQYQFVWAELRSKKVLQKCDQTHPLDLSCVLEARYFDGNGELRIIRDTDQDYAVQTVFEEQDDALILRSEISEKQTLVLRRYFHADEDGQMNVCRTCFCGLEGV